MSGIIFENKCANCGREPLAVGIPVLQNPAAEGKGAYCYVQSAEVGN